MSTTVAPTRPASDHSTRRSVGAIVGAILVTAIGTTIVDQLFHMLGVFPPWGQRFYDTGPYVLAVAYRVLFGIAGGYLVARWAPRAPRRHALWLGIIGTIVGAGGIVATITTAIGPMWYAVVVCLMAVPTASYGGALYERRAPR